MLDQRDLDLLQKMMESVMDARIAESEKRMDARIAEIVDTRIAESEKRMDARIVEVGGIRKSAVGGNGQAADQFNESNESDRESPGHDAA